MAEDKKKEIAYQIFVPNGERSPSLMQQLGIEDLAGGDGGPFFTDVLDNGPDGGAGLLVEFCDVTSKLDPGVDWKPCSPDETRGLPAGRFWWGLRRDGLTPELLARGEPLPGPLKLLGDGNVWQVPNMLLLPHRFTLDESTGGEATEVEPDWQHLYDRMQWAFTACGAMLENNGMATDEDSRQCRIYFAEVLAVNYRVNLELVRRLKLLSEKTWFDAVASTLDRKALHSIQEDLAKKKAASTRPG